MISFGIDIGGTSVKVASLRDGAVSWTGKSAPFVRPDTDQIVEAIRQAVAGRDVATNAVGLCCPGLLDRARRMITLSVNVPGLVDVPLDELIARALRPGRPPVAILSDANAVGYDIFTTRNLTGRLLSLALGTGVGASVIDEGGTFLHVSGESPGHLGQLDVSLDDHPPIGPDGGAGSLEAYIGAAALAEHYGEEAVHQLTADDPPVQALVRAIRIAHAIYRPQHICLSGGVGVRLNPLIEQIKTAVAKDLTRVARPGWTLTTGDDDYHAACGVARWAEHPQRKIPPNPT
jgi:predicted NBD/HSP70 family sugar kinase